MHEKRAAERKDEIRDINETMNRLVTPMMPRNWPVVACCAVGLLSALCGGFLVSHNASKREKQVVALTAGTVMALGVLVLTLRVSRTGPPPALSVAAAHSAELEVPKALHMTRDGGTVLVHYRVETVDHVLYAPDGANTSVGDSRNTQSLLWMETGSLRLRKDERSFSYLRKSSSPEFLDVNGTQYDLRQGEVIVLHDDGRAEQIKLFPTMAEASDPRMMSILVKNAREAESGPPIKTNLQERLRTAEMQLEKLLQTHAPEHPMVQAQRLAIADLKQRLAEEEGARR
jgi:hypothetical protein